MTDPGLERARAIKEAHEAELFARPGVLGVGIGRVGDEPEGEPAIVIYVEASGGRPPAGLDLPREIEGVRVRVVPTEPFVAR